MYYAGKILDVLIMLLIGVFFTTVAFNAESTGTLIFMGILVLLILYSVSIKIIRLISKKPEIKLTNDNLILNDIRKKYEFSRKKLKISRLKQLGGMLDLIIIKDLDAKIKKTVSVKEIPPSSRNLLIEYYEKMTD